MYPPTGIAPLRAGCPAQGDLPQHLVVFPPPLSSCAVPAVAGSPCVQNAECLLLFPVPLPRPGFYSQSLARFTSCVPAAACPGVDAVLVTAQYRSLLAGGAGTSMQLDAMLRQFFQVASAASANATHNASVGVVVVVGMRQSRHKSPAASFVMRMLRHGRGAPCVGRCVGGTVDCSCAGGGRRRQRDDWVGGASARAPGVPERVHPGLRPG